MARGPGKGISNNPAGKPKGVQNKLTVDLKTFLKDFLERNTENMQDDLRKLQPYQRLLITEKFMAYVLPKNTSLTGKDGEPLFNSTLNLVLHDAGDTVRTEEPEPAPE